MGRNYFERKYLKEEDYIENCHTLSKPIGDNFRIQYFIITKNTS